MKHPKYGNEKVDEIMAAPPEKRVAPTGNVMEDKIAGILVGFKYVLEAREGHVDFITTKMAANEIRELIEEEIERVHLLYGN